MSAVIKVLKREPFLIILGGMVGFASTGAIFMLGRSLLTDPTICLKDKKTNPLPWLSLSQSKNVKMVNFGRDFSSGIVKPTYIEPHSLRTY
jgi:hypothetical protein